MVEGALKVASWNLHKGTDCWGRPVSLDDSLDALAEQGWDVCFLQEAPGPEVALFAKRHGMQAVYGYTRSVGGGHFGNAILARRGEIDFLHNHDISAHRVESRRALMASLRWRDRKILAVATHFGLRQRWRVEQAQAVGAKALAAAAEQGCEAAIMGGDFNDRADAVSKALAACGLVDASAAFGPRAATYPAQFPLLPLDAIYAWGWSTQACGVLDPRARWASKSDHLPIFACLRP